MRNTLLFTILLSTASLAPAQSDQVDTYWQRQSGCKEYKELRPFRKPGEKLVGAQVSQLNDLLRSLRKMMAIANKADPKQVSFDSTGREVVQDDAWKAAYETVKQDGLKMAGWLGLILQKDVDAVRRGLAAYGMYYLNNPQEIFHLISYLPGEPRADIREAGMQRALEFLSVHLPESKPQNSKSPDNGIVVPRFLFNPLPFIQLLDQPNNVDIGQGIWFLSELLKIRPDLGRAYFDEIYEILPKLLRSKSKTVRLRTLDFLAAVDRKSNRRQKVGDSIEAQLEWVKTLDYELFPPIRRISSGVVDLYPSEDLDRLIAAGKKLLASGLQQGTAKGTGEFVRYGIRLDSVPAPLDQIGIPTGALIVAINAAPTRNVKELRLRIDEALKAAADYKKTEKKHEDEAKQKNQKPRPRRVTSLQFEYIVGGKTRMMELRLR